MFRKKLMKIDISPKYLCTCCWSSKPRRDSDVPRCRDMELKGQDVPDSSKDVTDDAKVPETPRSSGDGESNSQKGWF